MKIAVITVSDRASKGIYADLSGPAVEQVLLAGCPGAVIERAIVPDGKESVYDALMRHADADWIITTGGTGPSPRDQTPEATARYCDRLMPGIAEYFRSRSLEQTPFAVFSRGIAGMRGPQYVVNFPGSVKAAAFHAEILAPLLDHGTSMALSQGH
ncbi:MAG: MogA/MoaB family molybdenum cofactor biosynthesis protein [Rectinemataceae bacterium]|nr:MogA/MoaB family molybdenum cofactor biosynthesis protein [Rectinemataceae bacterium]